MDSWIRIGDSGTVFLPVLPPQEPSSLSDSEHEQQQQQKYLALLIEPSRVTSNYPVNASQIYESADAGPFLSEDIAKSGSIVEP